MTFEKKKFRCGCGARRRKGRNKKKDHKKESKEEEITDLSMQTQ